MSLGRSLGRALGVVAAIVGTYVTYIGFVVPSPGGLTGLEALLAGRVTPLVVVGVVGVLCTAAGLAVALGRGRTAAVSLGASLLVATMLALSLPILAGVEWVVAGVLGFVLFFAGASLNGHHGDVA